MNMIILVLIVSQTCQHEETEGHTHPLNHKPQAIIALSEPVIRQNVNTVWCFPKLILKVVVCTE